MKHYQVYLRGLLAVALTTITALSTHADFTIRSINIGGTSYLYLDDIANYFGMNVRHKDKKYYVHSDKNTIDFTLGKRRIAINSVSAYFSFAPKLNRSSALISELDFSLFIDPILRANGLPRHSIERVVVDPGHGGKDFGAIGSKYLEKNINLRIARFLRTMLENKGYSVLLTRDSDKYISLSQRGIITDEWEGDLFISIHSNVASNKSVTGIETYIVTPKGVPSTSKYTIHKKEVAGNAFNKLNARLAYEVHKRMLSATDVRDRGIKYYRYKVLREARCPALLVETGFLSNQFEERKLADSHYQKKLAISLANGIIAFDHSLQKR